MPRESEKIETTGVSVIGTRIAFYIWLTLLLASLATFALGLLGHIVTLLAAPWLGLLTQARIHATIPVLLTVVKFVTVPLLLLLTPFARHHKTFKSWTNWSKGKFLQLGVIVKAPWRLIVSVYSWATRRP